MDACVEVIFNSRKQTLRNYETSYGYTHCLSVRPLECENPIYNLKNLPSDQYNMSLSVNVCHSAMAHLVRKQFQVAVIV